MKKMHWIVGCIWMVISFQATAQERAWGSFLINVPDVWSMTQKAGSIQLSNYNIKDAEPFSITLFDASVLEGKADSAFALAWKKFVSPLTGNSEIPRPRRFYTDEGIPLFQGFKEMNDKTNPQYLQLNVYVVDNQYQACLLQTTTAKNYRLVQTEWQERLSGIKLLKSKNKK